jgi:hypothetical protein
MKSCPSTPTRLLYTIVFLFLISTCAAQCNDGLDNDGNSMADCCDANCSTSNVCFLEQGGAPLCPNGCFDTIDNDGDGLMRRGVRNQLSQLPPGLQRQNRQ